MKTTFKFTLLVWVCVGMPSQALAQYNLRTVPATPAAQDTMVTVATDRIDAIGRASPAATYSVTAPALAQGTYTLELLAGAMGESGNEVVETSVPLQIAGAVASAPTSIPATDSATRVLLAMLVGAIALVAWRSRQSHASSLCRVSVDLKSATARVGEVSAEASQ